MANLVGAEAGEHADIPSLGHGFRERLWRKLQLCSIEALSNPEAAIHETHAWYPTIDSCRMPSRLPYGVHGKHTGLPNESVSGRSSGPAAGGSRQLIGQAEYRWSKQSALHVA